MCTRTRKIRRALGLGLLGRGQTPLSGRGPVCSLLLAACLLLWGCAQSPPTGGSCETHQDCLAGEACIQDLCQQTDPLDIVTEMLPDGQIGASYQTQVLAIGGFGELAWSLQGAPAWLSIDSTSGELSGLPTDAGDVPVTVIVTDETDLQASRDYVIAVAGCTPGEVLACHAVDSGACWNGEWVCDASGNLGTCDPLSFSTSTDYCGPECGVCDPAVGTACLNGVCICGSGPGATGCESPEQCCDGVCVDVTSDPDNCGDCGNPCGTTQHLVGECVAGACSYNSCEEGWGNCDTDLTNGCELELNDLDDCGACDVSCGPLSNVVSHSCLPVGNTYACSYVCTPDHQDCDLDPANGCECLPAAHAVAGCNGTACDLTCDSDWFDCNGDPQDGCECGPAAADHGTISCNAGACELTCDSGWYDCNGDPLDGCESSLWHCGSCGASSGTEDCNGDPLDGCECGPASNATAACDVSACDLNCNSGWLNCNGSLTDGCECGPTPNATADCSSSSCSLTCNSGSYDCDGILSNGCEDTDSTCGVCPCTCTDQYGPVCHAEVGMWHDMSGPTFCECRCNDVDPPNPNLWGTCW